MQPAPVVTIVDPARPGPPPRDEPSYRRSSRAERLLGVAIAAVLVAGLNSTGAVREQARLGRLSVTAVLGGAVNEGSGLSARLRLVVDGAAQVIAVRADNGWRTVGAPVFSAGDDSRSSQLLARDVDCTGTVQAPSTVTVTAQAPSGARRTVVAQVREAEGVERAARTLCGDVDAAGALLVAGTGLLRTESGTRLELRLLNLSTAPLTVVSVGYPGVGMLPAGPLPLVLPGRAAGRLDLRDLQPQLLLLTSRIEDCDAMHAALDAGQRDLPPDLLDVRLDGRGGPVRSRVEVPGLHAYLKADEIASCP